jgi:apolipoprotein N-acyltransferase
MAFGHGRLQRPLAKGAPLTVGIVQASIPQDQKWESTLLQSNIDRHLNLSDEAVRRGAQLVVWPESAIGYELDLYPEVKKQIADFTTRAGIVLMAGNDDRERDSSGKMRSYVGAKVISPNGDIVMRYHKIRLVPFGEYLPLSTSLSTMLGLEKLVQGVSDFTPGSVARTTEVMGAFVGVFICYEAIFPSLVRRFPLNGAQVLFNLTNDGWYGTSAAPYQHYAMARFRAIENRRFLVRAANTGVSAIIDPFGRELLRSDLMESRVLVGEVRAVSEITFYSRYGDVFAWSMCLIAAAAVLSAFLKLARSNKLPLS